MFLMFCFQLESTKTKLEHQIANNYRKNRDRVNTVRNENAPNRIENLVV